MARIPINFDERAEDPPYMEAQAIHILAIPQVVGYWRSPHGMYRMAWYERPTRMFKFAAWMLGWKWEAS